MCGTNKVTSETEHLLYLQEIFDFRVVVGFLLNQRGSVELTRTESERAEDLDEQTK